LGSQIKDGQCECGGTKFRFYYEECLGELIDGEFTVINDNGEGARFAECLGCNKEYQLD
jgi:hypothetical protein